MDRLLEAPLSDDSLQHALQSAAGGGHIAVYDRLLAAGAEVTDASLMLTLTGNRLHQLDKLDPTARSFMTAMGLTPEFAARLRARAESLLPRLQPPPGGG